MSSFDIDDDDDDDDVSSLTVSKKTAVDAAESLVASSGSSVDVSRWQQQQLAVGRMIAISDQGACRRWCQGFPKNVMKELFIRWGLDDSYRETFDGRQPIPWLLDNRFADGISYADMAEMDLLLTMMKGRVGTKRWYRGTLVPFNTEPLKYPNFEVLSQRLGTGFSSFYQNYTTSDYYNGQLWVRITTSEISSKTVTVQAGSAENLSWGSVEVGGRRKKTIFMVFFPNSSTFFVAGFKLSEKPFIIQTVAEIYRAKTATIELMDAGTVQDLADLVLQRSAQGRVREFRPENDAQTNPLLRGSSAAATAVAGRKRTRPGGRSGAGGGADDDSDGEGDGDDDGGDNEGPTRPEWLPGGRRKGGGRRSKHVDPAVAARSQAAATAAAGGAAGSGAISREDRGLRERRQAAATQAFGAAAGQQPAIGQFLFHVSRSFDGVLRPGPVHLKHAMFDKPFVVRLRGSSVFEGVRNAMVRGLIASPEQLGDASQQTERPFNLMLESETSIMELK